MAAMHDDDEIDTLHELLLAHMVEIVDTVQSWFDSGVLTYHERERYAWITFQLGMVGATARELVDAVIEKDTTKEEDDGKDHH